MQGTRVTRTQYGFRSLQESSAKMCLKVTGYPLPEITWYKYLLFFQLIACYCAITHIGAISQRKIQQFYFQLACCINSSEMDENLLMSL